MQRKQSKEKEIGKVKLTEGQTLVVRLVDDERLDIRIWQESERYTGPTKRGVRFYLFDGIWEKFFEIMQKVNQEFEVIS